MLGDKMRRQDREITDYKHMLKIMSDCDCCRLGFNEEGGAYILPLNFAYDDTDEGLFLYFHGAREGKKLELIKAQGQAGFEMDTKHELAASSNPCACSYLYQSIIGKGEVALVEDAEEKAAALKLIVKRYTGRAAESIPSAALDKTAVIRLKITQWSCKEH